ncbi:unnamed protein product, partial [Vitis vinifera]|uniref:Uncharacterized protein n=1 Tax=Vitis vinifera TaxID=29760 RepID=D7THI2_VITVI
MEALYDSGKWSVLLHGTRENCVLSVNPGGSPNWVFTFGFSRYSNVKK